MHRHYRKRLSLCAKDKCVQMSSAALDSGFVPAPSWWLTHPEINSNRLSVLMALASFANSATHTCFPSQSTIAEMLQLSRSLVNRVIGELVEIGLIMKTHRKRADQGTTSCLYKIVFEQETSATHSSASTLSKTVTPPVTLGDRNKKNDKSSLYEDKSDQVKEWHPALATLQEIEKIRPGFDAQAYAEKMKGKVLKRGYQYPDLDMALLDWFREDQKRGLLDRKPRRPSAVTPKLKVAPPAPQLDHSEIPTDLAQASCLETHEGRFASAIIKVGRHRGASVFKSWLKDLKLVQFETGCLEIKAPSPFVRSHVIQNFGDEILHACRASGLPAERIA